MTNDTLTLKKAKKPNPTLEAAKKKTMAVVQDIVSEPTNAMDYQGMSFKGKDLTGKNVDGTFKYNFKNALCQGTDFTNANLAGQCFQGAHLEGADFTGANCAGADFRWSFLSGIITDDADFTDADVRESVGL